MLILSPSLFCKIKLKQFYAFNYSFKPTIFYLFQSFFLDFFRYIWHEIYPEGSFSFIRSYSPLNLNWMPIIHFLSDFFKVDWNIIDKSIDFKMKNIEDAHYNPDKYKMNHFQADHFYLLYQKLVIISSNLVQSKSS